MSKFLFEEFDPVSSKLWKQKIQADLKGVDYQTLIWKSNEGIDVKPFYHADEYAEDDFMAVPGLPASWSVCQSVFVDDVGIASQLAEDAVRRGAESILFVAEKPFPVEKLVENLDCTCYFELGFLDIDFYQKLVGFFSKKNHPFYVINDIITHLAQDGNWYENLEKDFDTIARLHPTHPLSIDISLYLNAGATGVQQLAYALSHAAEYFNRLKTGAQTQVIFKVAVGGNYFFEIAKLRALRILFATLAEEFGINPLCHILALPAKRNKTLYDYNVNMLRTTTECMSAVLGGADTVCNLAYDAVYHKSNEFGERISRNQLLLLKNESYLEEISHAADGAYYIETLTRQMAEKALELFKELEKSGGFLQQLKKGIIQKKIKANADKEQKQYDAGEKVLIGSNKYPNPVDGMKDDLELYPFVKTKPRKTLIEPVIERRISEKAEQERLGKEG